METIKESEFYAVVNVVKEQMYKNDNPKTLVDTVHASILRIGKAMPANEKELAISWIVARAYMETRRAHDFDLPYLNFRAAFCKKMEQTAKEAVDNTIKESHERRAH